MDGLITEGEFGGYSRHQPTFLELEKPHGTTIIDMNQSGNVVAAPDEKQRIGIFGLCGCTAVGVVATFPDGSRRAHIQHYDPFGKRMTGTIGSLEEAILGNEAAQGNYSTATKVSAAIMVPGRGIHMTPRDPEHANWLAETLRKDFGQETTVSVAPYSMNLSDSQSPYTTALVIDIPAEGSPEIFPEITRI